MRLDREKWDGTTLDEKEREREQMERATMAAASSGLNITYEVEDPGPGRPINLSNSVAYLHPCTRPFLFLANRLFVIRNSLDFVSQLQNYRTPTKCFHE